MSNRVCWSWRYRIRFFSMNRPQYHQLYKTCMVLFGNDQFHSLNRWELTSIPRGNYYLGERWYDRVAVHFKHREDLVLFKLTEDLAQYNGVIDG